MIKDRIEKLRQWMKQYSVDIYFVPTSDFHESEYVGDYFKSRMFITGFTGSAGTAVITQTEAGLWTDGRYFVQAASQLEGTGVTLRKAGTEGVPGIEEYIEGALPDHGVLGFDARVVNNQMGKRFENLVRKKQGTLFCDKDLIDEIWSDRPDLSAKPIWILEDRYAGKSAYDKIKDLRKKMAEYGASVHILTNLDDIAWLLNIRGNDVECNPVVLSYVMVTLNSFSLYVNEAVLNTEARLYLEDLGITIKPYHQVYEDVKDLREETVLMEGEKVNFAIGMYLDQSNEIMNKMNPTALEKARKNPVEISNMKQAHIKDGAAVTKFIYWLKKNIGKLAITEVSAEEYLDNLRYHTEGNLGLSFPTISAYGANAAMCHYSASREQQVKLEPKGLYLVDSGGQYYEGTTDITRTIALGPLTKQEREHFTLTVISMLRLANAVFLYGTRGITLDYIAREPFWRRGLNYDHGTGHGVGYLLNVHERPNGIRWKFVPERQDSCILEEGMVTSDEPGVYIEGSHGVRTENLLVCQKAEKNAYGQFMKFESLTYAPIDLDAIDTSLMTEEDISLLNEYHSKVYERLAPYLSEEETEWLRENTRAVER